MEYKVLKFGGSILKDRSEYMMVSSVVESEIKENNIPIPVVSAMKGVTDRIVEAVDAAYRQQPYDVEGLIEDLYKIHVAALPEDWIPNDVMREEFQQLKHVIRIRSLPWREIQLPRPI